MIFPALPGAGTIDSCIYFERTVNNGEESVELVKCPYAASNRGFVAAPTFRALMFSLLMSVAEVSTTRGIGLPFPPEYIYSIGSLLGNYVV